MSQISKELLTVVFYNENQDLVRYFNNLITIFIEFTKKQFDDLLSGNKGVEPDL